MGGVLVVCAWARLEYGTAAAASFADVQMLVSAGVTRPPWLQHSHMRALTGGRWMGLTVSR